MVLKRAVTGECPKKVAALVDLVNLPATLRQFAGGQSQMSHLSFFLRVWSHIKDNSLQDPTNKNIVNCDGKLKSILLGKPKVELSELPALVKLHFPKASKVVHVCPSSGAKAEAKVKSGDGRRSRRRKNDARSTEGPKFGARRGQCAEMKKCRNSRLERPKDRILDDSLVGCLTIKFQLQ